MCSVFRCCVVVATVIVLVVVHVGSTKPFKRTLKSQLETLPFDINV